MAKTKHEKMSDSIHDYLGDNLKGAERRMSRILERVRDHIAYLELVYSESEYHTAAEGKAIDAWWEAEKSLKRAITVLNKVK